VAWPESRTHEFTVGDCEQLRLKFVKFAGAPGAGFLKRWWRDLTGKNPEIPQAEHDRYLQAGIDCFDAMLQAKHPAGDAGTVIGLPELAVLLLAPVALWLVLVAVLWRVNRRGGGRPAGSSERTAAMLGALFGVPAGFAVYDRMFKGAPPGKPLADASELFPPPPPAPPAEGEGEPPERPTR
jgi:hypothetical protein